MEELEGALDILGGLPHHDQAGMLGSPGREGSPQAGQRAPCPSPCQGFSTSLVSGPTSSPASHWNHSGSKRDFEVLSTPSPLAS